MKIINQEEHDRFYEYLYANNFNENIEELQITNLIINTERVLRSLLKENSDTECNKSSKKQAKNNAKKFLTEKFKLHKVLISTNFKINIVRLIKGSKNTEKFIKALEKTGTLVDPFKIPIIYKKEEIKLTGVGVSLPVDPKIIEKELRAYNNIYYNINLGTKITDLTPGDYIHEITHTQINRAKNANTDYYNSELIPIFLENIYYREVSPELTHANNIRRINNLLKNIKYLKLYNQIKEKNQEKAEEHKYKIYEASKYLISTLNAYHLVTIYENGNEDTKKQILERIQQIFDDKYTIEELLLEYNITFNNSLENKVLTKSFK